MIYFTGDTHADFRRFANKRMKKLELEMSEQDYIIVCGDFGLCWSKDSSFDYFCNFFSEKKYTILWVQGNHENYDMIAEYPLEEWHGGKVRHIIRDKVILLERGQVFMIEGKKFFTFGGASSHDIDAGILELDDPDFKAKKKLLDSRWALYRINHVSWWKEELPSEEEMQEGKDNLKMHDYKVDYVITHCASTYVQYDLGNKLSKSYEPDSLTDYFQELEDTLEYKHWFFGHYHFDMEVDEKHTLLYEKIVPLENYEVEKKDSQINQAVEQVIATMKLSGMPIDDAFREELRKISRGEKTSEELRQEILKKYKKE